MSKYRREIIFFFLVFLTISVSFAFGYILGRGEGRTPIIIQQLSPKNEL